MYKVCEGLLRYQKETDPVVFDMACEIAIDQKSVNYSFIRRLITTKCTGFLESYTSVDDEPTNGNLRGKDYYKQLINRD